MPRAARPVPSGVANANLRARERGEQAADATRAERGRLLGREPEVAGPDGGREGRQGGRDRAQVVVEGGAPVAGGDECRGALELGARRVARGIRGDELEVVVVGGCRAGGACRCPDGSGPGSVPEAQGRAGERPRDEAGADERGADEHEQDGDARATGPELRAVGRRGLGRDRTRPRRRLGSGCRPGARLERRVARRRCDSPAVSEPGDALTRSAGCAPAARVSCAARRSMPRSRPAGASSATPSPAAVAAPPLARGQPPEATRTPTMPRAARPVPSGVANENLRARERGEEAADAARAERGRLLGREPEVAGPDGGREVGSAAAMARRSWWRAAHPAQVATRAVARSRPGRLGVARGIRGDELEVVGSWAAVGDVGHQSPSPRNRPMEPSRRSRSASRPRWIRDFTVPSETPVRSAISW